MCCQIPAEPAGSQTPHRLRKTRIKCLATSDLRLYLQKVHRIFQKNTPDRRQFGSIRWGLTWREENWVQEKRKAFAGIIESLFRKLDRDKS